MELWFSKKHNGIRDYNSKLLKLRFVPKYWRLLQWKNNGAIKGKHRCYDLNIYILGVFFSYSNFDYK